MKTAAPAALALTLLAGSARGDDVFRRDEPRKDSGDGVQLQIGLAEHALPLALSLQGTGLGGYQPGARLGYRIGQTAILLGVSLLRASTTNGSDTQSLQWIELAPTVRYYLQPAKAGTLVPYVEGEFDWVGLTQQVPNQSRPNPTIYGGGLGFGGEYLITPSFGVGADLSLRYLSTSQDSTTSSTLTVGGSAALNLHF